MKTNIIKLTDSYKFTHWPMLPEGTEAVYSYFEARKGATYDTTVFFGLQALLKEYLEGIVVTHFKIEDAARLSKAHFGNDAIFNREGWEEILNVWGGKLPVIIKAVPEGTPVPISNVMMTIVNLGGPKCAFLTNHLETLLSQIWYPSTVATLSRETKKSIKHFLEHTADNLGGLNFMLHDFGFRGATSVEAAGLGGAAHLVNFLGTDTVRGMEFAMEYYDADINGVGFSVAATEHSIMTARGPEGEADVVGQLLKVYPTGILAMVIDSYDYRNFINQIAGVQYKEQILARDGVVVFRPDSGDPEAVTLEVITGLGKAFGFTVNSKGYRVLNPKVRVLWGDGIEKRGIENILGVLSVNGWSAENMVFGMGGGLLQKVNRDTQRFAFKCAAQLRNGLWEDIYKNPIDKSKASKRGRLKLVKDTDGTFITVPEADPRKDELVTVFDCGVVTKTWTFDEIRANAAL